MKRPTLSDIGITWCYWVSAAGFRFASAEAVYAVRFEPQSKGTILLCGAFFGLVAILAFLWPILRIREAQGIRVIHPDHRMQFRGVLIPISQVKIVIAVLGGSICAIGAMLV